MTGGPGPGSKVEDVFVVLEVTDVGGKNLDGILLVDDRSTQDRGNGGGGMGLMFAFGGEVVDFVGSEGRDEGRERSDEAGRIEGKFFDGGIDEDVIREQRGWFGGSGILEGEDQDPLSSGERESGYVASSRIVATCDTDRGVGGAFEPVDDILI